MTLLLLSCIVQFVTYDNLRKFFSRMADRRGYAITSYEFFFMGAVAKAVATVFTYPLQIAQSRLRADRGKSGGNKGSRQYTGTLDCLRKIAAKNGIRGWYKGMEAKLWQTVLTAAFQFTT
jgi:adenine nucleotide transporter 17